MRERLCWASFADCNGHKHLAGITPMRAMFLEFEKRGAPVTLLYSVRAPSEAAFLPALRAAAADSHSSIRVVLTVTGSGDAAWQGRRGRIDRALISQEVRACMAAEKFVHAQ